MVLSVNSTSTRTGEIQNCKISEMKCSCLEGYADVSRRTTDLKYLEHHNCNIPAVSCTLRIAKCTLVFWAIGHYGKNSGLTCRLRWWYITADRTPSYSFMFLSCVCDWSHFPILWKIRTHCLHSQFMI
jgi:hypothetical protein